jgi:hypothetical protein
MKKYLLFGFLSLLVLTGCGGSPCEYETDGGDFTITCPNGHGNVHNDGTS